ncbi:MAG: tetraacyldisaccharide 4'-kinase [Bacteroidales bacterium]|nr:tetraacyldisaccharide 4'-kinase [Bacteroidales bacterium]
MKRKRSWLAKALLLPLSKIYGAVTFVRNWMFEAHILKQKEFPVPVVVVGNLAAGGTGKTPMVDYIVDNLRHSCHLGVVSRGYKRSTHGFVMATKRSTPIDIGDEPYMLYHKYDGEVPVAVCEDRVAGITELLKIDPQINLVLLDDAFQHRYVKPTVTILLTEYNLPFFEDSLLPYGRLRESKRGARRADIIVATKCPARPSPLDLHIFKENLDLVACQQLFFSRVLYGKLMPAFPDEAPQIAPSLDWLGEDDRLLCVAGIGNPRPFVKFVKHFKPKVRVNIYPDHHNFTRKDMATLQQRFETMEARHKFLITTEKDAVRMANCPYFPHALKAKTYYLPIKVDFMRDENQPFIESILKLIKDHRAQQGLRT